MGDRETENKIPPASILNSSVDNDREAVRKRLRDDASEDEPSDTLPSKKFCTNASVEAERKPGADIESTGVNGIGRDTKESVEGGVEEDAGKTEGYTLDGSRTSDVGDGEKKAVVEKRDVTEEKGVPVVESKSEDGKAAKEDEKEDEEKGKDDIIPEKKQSRRPRNNDATEVVDGLELSVECASDRDTSSSSSEDEKDERPKPKTVIVKAEPNDSELDVGSSAADEARSDESDSRDVAAETKPHGQAARKGRKKSRTSFGRATKNSDSDEDNDDVSDEDYSPKTKNRRLLKKTVASKRSSQKSPTRESKRGRGRAKKGTRKSSDKEDAEDENSNSVTTSNVKVEDAKVEEAVHHSSDDDDNESLKSGSEDESDSEDATKAEDGRRRRNRRPEDDKRIQSLKKYIRMTGIRVKSYNELWTGCKTNNARVKCLRELLEKNGVTGRPTVEKCKRAKERNERLKDVADLNTGNIISEGRVTRAQRNKDSTNKEIKTPETPTRHREARNTFKRVLNVIDSDSD